MLAAALRQDLQRAAWPLSATADALLAAQTSLRVGGPAELLAEARTLGDLERWLRLAREREVPVTVLGKASNVLVADRGLPGLVLLNRAAEERLEEGQLVVASGAPLPTLAGRLARRGLGGLEWAAGVPGTVGGALCSNAGAHGGEMAALTLWARLVDLQGQDHRWGPAELELGYRSSRLRREPGWVVLEAGLALQPDDPRRLLQRLREFNAYRRATQPPEHSVGSIFKNPPGDHAGRLIEAAGLKGMRVGGAQVSAVHANFIVNRGRASAADCWELIQRVREQVLRRLAVELELEIVLLGRWPAGGA